MHILLQGQEQGSREIKTWALLPILLISALYAYLYYRLFMFGSRYMKAFIARKEIQYNIKLNYQFRGLSFKGKIGTYDSIVLHLQIMFGYFIAFFAPLLLTRVLLFLIPEHWWDVFFK